MKPNKKIGISFLLLALFAVFVLASGPASAQKLPVAAESSTISTTGPAQGNAAGYAGTESCVSCHRVRVEQVARTVHGTTRVAGTNMPTNCEGCHGPGKAHADAETEAERTSTKNPEASKLIFAFEGSAQENSGRCLTCHGTGRAQQAFATSEHKLQGVSCDQCHSAHLLLPDDRRDRVGVAGAQAQFFTVPKMAEQNRWLSESLLRESQPELCFTCHQSVKAAFALPTHHRVPEGLMKCSDCHNPHGAGNNRTMLTKSNWETCVGCHIEKRGPFVFEHPSVKVEGCVTCHNPHGSINRNLLLRAEGRFLCLQCHVDPQAANVPHGRLGFQTGGECVRCHVAVHGSNSTPFLIR